MRGRDCSPRIAAGTRKAGRREKMRNSDPDIPVIDRATIVIRSRTFPSMEPERGGAQSQNRLDASSAEMTDPYRS